MRWWVAFALIEALVVLAFIAVGTAMGERYAAMQCLASESECRRLAGERP